MRLFQHRIVYLHPSKGNGCGTLLPSPSGTRYPRGKETGIPLLPASELHMGGSHPPEGSDYRIAICRLDVRVFQGCQNQAPKLRAFPQAKSLAPIGYSQIVKPVSEERAGRPFYTNISGWHLSCPSYSERTRVGGTDGRCKCKIRQIIPRKMY